jgi:hypothetical protein
MSVDPPQDPVTVYSFMTFDDSVEMGQVAPFKATREAVASHFGGLVLEGTAQQVDASDLDASGRLRRVATGWGALEDG